jgi:hypothetical protein
VIFNDSGAVPASQQQQKRPAVTETTRYHRTVTYQLLKVCGLVADLAAASAADDCGPPPYIAVIYNYNI